MHKELTVKHLPCPTGRVIAVGDIHGCLDELLRAMDIIDLKKEDTLIFLGDLPDRGPCPNSVIQYIKSISQTFDVHCVLGNHDEKHVRYAWHEAKKKENPTYKNPMKTNEDFLRTHQSLTEDSIEYLASLPHAIYIVGEPPLVFVHAGVTPSGFNQSPNAFIRNRYFTKDQVSGKLVPAHYINIDGEYYQPEGSSHWAELWDGRWTVVYGHSVEKYPKVVNNTYGIDTGCVFGGDLCVWIKAPNRPPKFEFVKSGFNFNEKDQND